MGNVCVKQPKVTDPNGAVLSLENQLQQLALYLQKLEQVIEAEEKAAKELIHKHNKDKALIALKKKKIKENLKKQVGTWITNVEQQLAGIELATKQKAVYESLKAGIDAVKAIQREISLDDVKKLMDDTDDAKAYQEEMNALLGHKLSIEDEEEIEEEFNKLNADQLSDLKFNQPPDAVTVVVTPVKHKECTQDLEKQIREITGVESVEVDFSNDQVRGKGMAADPSELGKLASDICKSESRKYDVRKKARKQALMAKDDEEMKDLEKPKKYGKEAKVESDKIRPSKNRPPKSARASTSTTSSEIKGMTAPTKLDQDSVSYKGKEKALVEEDGNPSPTKLENYKSKPTRKLADPAMNEEKKDDDQKGFDMIGKNENRASKISSVDEDDAFKKTRQEDKKSTSLPDQVLMKRSVSYRPCNSPFSDFTDMFSDDNPNACNIM